MSVITNFFNTLTNNNYEKFQPFYTAATMRLFLCFL